MFQFPAFACTMCMTGLQPVGLPHSEISGSSLVCCSPELFAAYHVLLRLQKPRHPPSALFFLRHSLCPSATSLPLQVFALKLQSLTRYLLSYYRLNQFFLLYLVIFLNIVNELTVVSQTGCKDTHFFIHSKFFCTFFSFFNNFFFMPYYAYSVNT